MSDSDRHFAARERSEVAPIDTTSIAESEADDAVAIIDKQMKRDDLTDFQVSVLVLARAYLGPQPRAKRDKRNRA